MLPCRVASQRIAAASEGRSFLMRLLRQSLSTSILTSRSTSFSASRLASESSTSISINGNMMEATESLLKPTLHVEICLNTASASNQVRKTVGHSLSWEELKCIPR